MKFIKSKSSIFGARYILGMIFFAILGFSIFPRSAEAKDLDKSSIIIKGKDGWLFPRWGSLKMRDDAGIDNSTSLIGQVKNLLNSKDIKLEVLLLPDKVRFYQNKLPDEDVMSPEVLQRYAVILEKLNKVGISTFDAEDVLRKVQKTGEDVFYRTDQHWTQASADAVAEATAAMIKRDFPQLSGTAGSGMTLGGPIKERRYGDLAELFLSPEEKKQIGRDTFIIRKESQTNSLIDDGVAPIHITGHSMVQPYFGFPQKLSNLLDRSVSLNWKSGNVGPWVMLLEYVESPAFKQKKPQVLVWQLFEPAYAQGPNAKGMWDNASIMTEEAWLSRFKKAIKE